MKKTDRISYKEKTVAELKSLLSAARTKLVESRAKNSTGNLKDVSILSKIKYEISYFSTLINNKKND